MRSPVINDAKTTDAFLLSPKFDDFTRIVFELKRRAG